MASVGHRFGHLFNHGAVKVLVPDLRYTFYRSVRFSSVT